MIDAVNADRRRVTFTVWGVAQPKGSTKAFVPKGWTRPIVTNDNPKSKGWQQLVAEQAQSVAFELNRPDRPDAGVFTGPVVLIVTFHLPRPASLPRRILHHLKKPDLDKLVRCTKDALTGILYADDSQVVELHARKVYAAATATPRAHVTLEAAPLEDRELIAVLF